MDSVEGWNMGLSGLQDNEDDIEQVSIEVERTRKQSWWKNMFVKKIQTKNAKGSNEYEKEQKEEIIFGETIDIPLREKNWEDVVLDTANKWTHGRRMESTPINTQQSIESLTYESLGNTSESESTNTLAKNEDDILEFDEYIKMHQHKTPTKKQEILRRLLNSQTQPSVSTLCEKEKTSSIIVRHSILREMKENTSVERRWCNRGRTGRREEVHGRIRSKKVREILDGIESCTLNESEGESYHLSRGVLSIYPSVTMTDLK